MVSCKTTSILKKFESFLVFLIFKFIHPFKAYDVFKEDENEDQSCNCDSKSESGYFSSKSSSSSVSLKILAIWRDQSMSADLKYERI